MTTSPRPEGIEPTAEQLEIRHAAARSIVVAANAGAAKTTTLALRIAAALAEGTPPERMLALTFTPAACRALDLALKKVGVPPALARRVPVRTFEDFAASVLLGIERRPVPRRATPEDLAPGVWAAVRALDCAADDGIVERFLAAARRLKGSLARDRLRWDGLRLDADRAEDLGVELVLLRLFDAYERLRDPRTDGADRPRFRGEFDATYDLARLLADPDSDTPLAEMGAWPRQVAHLLVDEMHDLNLAMFTILRALLQNPATRFCGVGDVDQVVHAGSGAEQRFMAPDVDLGAGRRAVFLPLTATRRFDRRLARAAGQLAGKAYASDCPHPTRLACHACDDDGPGATAPRLLAELKDWQATAGGRLDGVAILLRHPYQSVAIENALVRAEIAYAPLGFESYLLQPEVLLVRALLAVAVGDFASLASESTRRRLVRALVFFCGVELSFEGSERESPEERLAEAVDHVARDAASLAPFFDYQVLQRGDPAMARRLRAAIAVAREVEGPAMFPRLLEALQMETLVRNVFVEQARRADALAYMAGLAQAAREFTSAGEFFEGLNRAETRALGDAGPLRQAARSAALKRSTLTLATVAAVKGLEFDHVMLPGLRQGEFPAVLGTTDREERNLFYVGITRARRALTLFVSASRPSSLVAAAGLGPAPPA